MADALSRVLNYYLAVPSILFPRVTGKSKGVDYKLLFVFLVVGVLHPHLFPILYSFIFYLHLAIFSAILQIVAIICTSVM